MHGLNQFASASDSAKQYNSWLQLKKNHFL